MRRARTADGIHALIKPDELALWAGVRATGDTPRIVEERLGLHRKRVVVLCNKWFDRHLYSCGVASDLGWITERGEKEGLPPF